MAPDTTTVRTASAVCAARTLSAVEQKNATFLHEAFFRQSWADVQQAMHGRGEGIFQRLAAILFKPEALAADRVTPALEFLRGHGFAPAGWRWVTLNRHMINIMWWWQWNVATLDRLDLAEELYCAGESLLLILRDEVPLDRYPATVRLRRLKGPAQPDLRRPDHLRTVLGAPNRAMSLVHAPDEPIDLVREIGILLTHPQRVAFLTELVAAYDRPRSRWPDLMRDIDQSRRRIAASDLDADTAMGRLRDRAGPSMVTGLVEGMRQGMSWRDADARIRQAAPTLPDWDRLTIGASLIPHDIPGEVCTIDDDGVHHWTSGLGQIIPDGNLTIPGTATALNACHTRQKGEPQ